MFNTTVLYEIYELGKSKDLCACFGLFIESFAWLFI